MLLFSSRALLAVTNQSSITTETATCMHRNRKPYNSFFIANKVSGVDCVHMLPMTPTQWNRAAILHLKPSHAALIWSYIYENWKSMLWSIDCCQNKVSADQYHVTKSLAQILGSSRSHFFLMLTADQRLVFAWIVGSSHVNLLISAGLFRRYNSIAFMLRRLRLLKFETEVQTM